MAMRLAITNGTDSGFPLSALAVITKLRNAHMPSLRSRDAHAPYGHLEVETRESLSAPGWRMNSVTSRRT